MIRLLDRLFCPPAAVLKVGDHAVPIRFVHNHKALRYILRIQPDGSLRATVPRAGSIKKAQAFAERNLDWVAKQLQKRQERPAQPRSWQPGTEILYRGQPVTLKQDGDVVEFGDQSVRVTDAVNLRSAIERHLWHLAHKELQPRTRELAALHNVSIQRITIRNQRSRWGSCSRRGTISLNWRLIQTPEFVRDYIILHELMHRREPNHSKNYWKHVANVCLNYEKAEAWLKQHRGLLR